jgi:hypothetical protein
MKLLQIIQNIVELGICQSSTQKEWDAGAACDCREVELGTDDHQIVKIVNCEIVLLNHEIPI